MAEPSQENVTGVEEYDHRAVAHLRAYHEARKALDALVRAMNDNDLRIGQEKWLKMAEQMAASLTYSDSSGHPHNDCPGETEGAWPYAVVFESESFIRGSYRCAHCGEEWTCGYDVNIGAWF